VFARVRLAATATLVGLLVLEGGARALPASFTAPREVVLGGPRLEHLLVASEDVPGWDLSPTGGEAAGVLYTANRWRMRGPDYAQEPAPGAQRVAFVGDSAVFGHALGWEQTFAARFAALRAARTGRPVEVGACAAPGHSSAQSVHKLRSHCLAFRPDAVVIASRNSDRTLDVASDAERFRLAAYAGPTRWLRASAAFRLMRNAWLRERIARTPPGASAFSIAQEGRPMGTRRRVEVADYAANLREMVDMSRGAGATPVLLALPLRDGGDGIRDTAYEDAMRGVAASTGVTLVDAAPGFAPVARAPGVFLDPVHPGVVGAEMLAQFLDATLP
jgi:hypothetical protein